MTMDLPTELNIEYKRLKRNFDDLNLGWQEHIARDLVACLRNWVQLAAKTDEYATSENWKLMFPVHQKTKAEKKVFNDGSEAVYTPGIVSNGPLQVAGASIHQGKLSAEQVRAVALAGPDGGPNNQATTLTSWLNTEVYEMRSNGKRTGISRKLFIERCANMLGGTHPVTTYIAELNEQVFDQQIKELLDTRIADIPLPWSLISEAANGIIKAFEQYQQS
jgi:hypothetical protein